MPKGTRVGVTVATQEELEGEKLSDGESYERIGVFALDQPLEVKIVAGNEHSTSLIATSEVERKARELVYAIEDRITREEDRRGVPQEPESDEQRPKSSSSHRRISR